MDKRRLLFIFSAMITLSLFGLLGMYAYRFNKYKDYIKLERLIVTELKHDEYKEQIKDNKAIITSDNLIDMEFKVNDEDCLGYGVINKYWFIYTYKGYIKCEKYTTKGFKEQT